MSGEEVAVFKERALKAFERAREAFQAEDYEWSMFLLEQAVQLLAKYFLALKIGYFPRSHSLLRMLEEAGRINEEVKSYLRRHRDSLLALEDAYIRARYLPGRYSVEDVRNKFPLFKKFLEIVENMRALKLEKRIAEERRRYFDDWMGYAKRIKEVAEKELGEAKVYVFGSLVKNQAHPALSDIDVLIASPNMPDPLDERAKLKARILEAVGPLNPFEIHLANPREHRWYRKYIMDKHIPV
ncbi:HEPN domain-containing protein [Candidatus Bathyarchaeota archaeon]|nr:HEPN domain-containing protein [Candidatus Bathyarchaeota archaeon]